MTVRTRFAPSPTGYLHIGGVRTALFNWLFARQHGGQFLLRVDDTDQQRNVEAALAPILHGFRWLGLDWDEGPELGGPHAPYFQSQRSELYQKAADELLARGAAYRDFATTEEIQAEREAAQQAGRQFTYSRRWEAKGQADVARFEGEGRQAVVRLKMPREGELVLDDLVRGEVRFAWANEQDHVVQRADGSCLYHLASVVDDQEMRISHVIRAEEHLPNTPRQAFIALALGYPLPAYAHLPYVAEPGSKNKLSKRKLDKYLKNKDFQSIYNHGLEVATALNQQLRKFVESKGTSASAENRDDIIRKLKPAMLNSLPVISADINVQKEMEGLVLSHVESIFQHPAYLEAYERGTELQRSLGIVADPATFNPVIVDFYEKTGFLADAVLNYLLLLGWSLDGVREDFSRAEMIQSFSLDRVVKAPASFDPQKLMAFQERAMQRLPLKQKVALCLQFLQEAGIVPRPPSCELGPYLTKIIDAAGDRIKIAGDVVAYENFLRDDEHLLVDTNAFKKAFRDRAQSEELLNEYVQELSSVEPFDPPTLESHLQDFVQSRGKKLGDIVQPIRVALTGRGVGFGLFDALAILGKDSCIRRINSALRILDSLLME
jgi:glutamyl/glutaminyl-tRNA synthetase